MVVRLEIAMKLEDMGLKKQTVTALKKCGFETIGDVFNAAVKANGGGRWGFAAGLLRFRGIGKSALFDLLSALRLSL
jgi:hypothetical protein